MKVSTLALVVSVLFCANGVFAASADSTVKTHYTQSDAKKKKDLSKLMGPGAGDAAARMKPENEKVKEAEKLASNGQLFESQQEKFKAEFYREERLKAETAQLEKEKLKVEELKAAYKKESEAFVAAAKKNKSDKNWIKGEEAAKFKKAVADSEIALRNAEIDCKGHASAIASAAEAA